MFSAADDSFSMMVGFGSCTVVYNFSYNVPHERKMSMSLLDLIGSTKIAFESYGYDISMYCISQLMMNGKRPVISLWNFTVLGSARPIAANK